MTLCHFVQLKKGNIVATFTLQDLNQVPITPDEEDKPSMYWNHRLVDMSHEDGENNWLEVQEVFYNGEGQPCGHCDPCVGGETIDEIQIQIQRFTECLSMPILKSPDDFNNKFDGEDDGKEQA